MAETEREGVRGRVAVLVAGAAAVVLASSPARSFEEAVAKANFSKEVADCTAYYTWSERYAEKLNHPEQAEQFGKSKDWSFGLLMMVKSQPSDFTKIKAEVAEAVSRMDAMGENEAADKLPQTYQDLCDDLVQHPEMRYKYWTEKSD